MNTPGDEECVYLEEQQGDTLVVQEKVQQFKQFPQLNSQIATKQMDNVGQSNANYAFYNNSTYYGIVGSMLQGGGEAQTQFQKDKVSTSGSTEQEMIFNFNGLAEWQHFNGIAMN